MQYVAAQQRIESRHTQDFGDIVDWSFIAGTECQGIKRAQLMNASIRIEGRGNARQSAQHPACAEARIKHIKMAHTIQQRKNARVWTHAVGEIPDGAVQVVGFAADNDQPVDRFEIFCAHQRRSRQVDVAQGAGDRQTTPAELFRAALSDQKSDIAARRCQASAKIAAYGARADNENLHSFLIS